MADPSTPLKDLVAGRAVENHLIVAMTTLFIYDAVLTFSTEVKYVWFHQWNFGRIAFHFNRIWGLLITVITLPATFSHSTSRKTFVLSHFANSRRFTMLQVPGDINRRIWVRSCFSGSQHYLCHDPAHVDSLRQEENNTLVRCTTRFGTSQSSLTHPLAH
ncbi:hypothetical protein FRC08_010992 [Ceratobasidium sp. 394]|nr:hypothetical protein FRC08_010992 [Ceratobasidium sp. 394]